MLHDEAQGVTYVALCIRKNMVIVALTQWLDKVTSRLEYERALSDSPDHQDIRVV